MATRLWGAAFQFASYSISAHRAWSKDHGAIFKEFETCSAYTKLHSVTTLVRAVALANYYPTLARAVSRLATNDAQARQELYEHARTVLAKHLRKQDPQMSAPETIGERIAFEAAILRLEAEWQSALKRNAKPDITSQLHQHTHVWPAPDNLLIPLSQLSVRVAKLQQLRPPSGHNLLYKCWPRPLGSMGTE